MTTAHGVNQERTVMGNETSFDYPAPGVDGYTFSIAGTARTD